jgi:2-dehydropantoate 2-reductase
VTLRLGFFGAGAVGTYLGIRLSAAGAPVTLIGRSSLPSPSAARAVTLAGAATSPSAELRVSTDAALLRDADVCFVSVKSQDTDTAGRALAPVLRPDTVVISLQNGLGNAARLRACGVTAAQSGLITFNVVRGADGTFRQATSGPLTTAAPPRHAEELAAVFARAGEPLHYRADIEGLLATKLLFNLYNGISALAGFPTAQALRSRELRRAAAACMREGLRCYRAAGIHTVRIGRLAPAFSALLLPLPNWIVLRVAPAMVAVDPAARSSTLQDIERGKPTEIDFLNGAIAELGRRHGIPTPANDFVVRAIHALERERRHLAPEAIRRGVGR